MEPRRSKRQAVKAENRKKTIAVADPAPSPISSVPVEVLENILLLLPEIDLLLAQRVCADWRAAIQGSQKIQEALFLRPAKHATDAIGDEAMRWTTMRWKLTCKTQHKEDTPIRWNPLLRYQLEKRSRPSNRSRARETDPYVTQPPRQKIRVSVNRPMSMSHLVHSEDGVRVSDVDVILDEFLEYVWRKTGGSVFDFHVCISTETAGRKN